MPPMEPEDPFVEAFAQYLDALQEATCDRLLERQPTPGKLKTAGKMLVKAAAPDIKETAEKLSILVDVLEAQEQLVSSDFYEIKEVTDTLREFGPRLEKNYGLTLYAGVSSESDGTGYLDTCLGQSVAVGKGELRSTIFVKNLVGQTGNRLMKEKGSTARTVGWVDDHYGVCHDLEARAEHAMMGWKRFKGFEKDEEDAREVRLRKLAYERLFEKFGDDCQGFAMEAALNGINGTAAHEFHHERIVGRSGACRQIREACAYLYALSKAQGAEAVFDGLYSIYRIRHDSDARYVSASAMALDYLRKAGYSEESWLSIGPDERAGVSVRIASQAKEALKILEEECSLRKHEDVEALLKPDFEGYGALAMDAVTAYYAGRMEN